MKLYDLLCEVGQLREDHDDMPVKVYSFNPALNEEVVVDVKEVRLDKTCRQVLIVV